MSIKKYGIYVAYPPLVDMRHEGLGRYLAAFLKGASARNDLKFILACPSWSKKDLSKLFESECVPKECFEIISPRNKPWIINFYEWKFSKRPKQNRVNWLNIFSKKLSQILLFAEDRIASILFVHSLFGFLLLPFRLLLIFSIFILMLPFLLIVVLFKILASLKFFFKTLNTAFFEKQQNSRKLNLARKLLQKTKLLSSPLSFLLNLISPSRIYKKVQSFEGDRLIKIINKRQDISVWYAPAVFWPEFNKIKAPRLLCVPDVVLANFPIGFSLAYKTHVLTTFKTISKTIKAAEHMVTYSNVTKWNTLVDYFKVPADTIHVVHHAPNIFEHLTKTQGTPNDHLASEIYCKNLFSHALQKSTQPAYSCSFKNQDVQFLFYASQFRPSKNILVLLRAYEYLLRRCRITHKLILTGDPNVYAPVNKFIAKYRLQRDVLCLHGLSLSELAACYQLADLAVNPSLSEGGCPFTFTEALSVGTPVVMARIPVTEEVLTDSQLQEMTFFDPYDWKDMAKRIEWALNNREALLKVQQKTYAVLSKRTWADVVNEHITIMDSLAEKASQKKATG